MVIFLTIVQVLVSLALIGLVLIQKGQGSDIGSAFGSGASQTVFGSQGSANFLTRATGLAAAVFFLSSLGLSYLSTRTGQDSVMTDAPATSRPAQGQVPAPTQQPPSGPVPGAQPGPAGLPGTGTPP